MTTWVILDQPRADRITVKFTSDDGHQTITMPDLFWDQVTPIAEWVSRINPWPAPPADLRGVPQSFIGLTGTSLQPPRTPPLTEKEMEELRAKAPPRDPLTVV